MAWQAFDETLPLEWPLIARGPSEYPELESISVWIVQLDPKGDVAAAAAGMGVPEMTVDPAGDDANRWSLELEASSQTGRLEPGPARGFAIAQPPAAATRVWFMDLTLTDGTVAYEAAASSEAPAPS